MCRHLAYIGPPITLSALIYDPPHSLYRQSWTPKYQTSDIVNVDGFGVGWYVEGRVEPVRYRRAMPIWYDVSFASVASSVSATHVLAALRAASPGFPIDETSAAPFTRDRFLFSLNGTVRDWATTAPKLHERLTPEQTALIEAANDSAVLWVMTYARLLKGEPLGDALAGVVADVLDVSGGKMNMLLADGESVAATTYGHTLFVRDDGESLVICSEPYDEHPAWQQVPQASLVTMSTAEGIRIEPLGVEPPPEVT